MGWKIAITKTLRTKGLNEETRAIIARSFGKYCLALLRYSAECLELGITDATANNASIEEIIEEAVEFPEQSEKLEKV